MTNDYYRYRQEFCYIKMFLSSFFAILLAGLILLLIVRWYVRETAKDIKDASTYILQKNLEARQKFLNLDSKKSD